MNKIALSSNDDKRLKSIDSIETYGHGMSKGLIWKKEKTKRINIIEEYKKIINFDEVVKENINQHNPKQPHIFDYLYRILINSLFNLTNHQSDIDKMYLYSKDPYEAKYQFLITKQEDIETKHYNDSKASIEYSNTMVDIYKNIDDYNANKKPKILIFL